MENTKRLHSLQPARRSWIPFFLPLLVFVLDSCTCSPLDAQTEAALLSRVEAKHELFPTYVFGKSVTGSSMIYKPTVSGLRDFRKFFVLQTDSYLIDLWLQATGARSFTLVLDFSALHNRIRPPSLDMWQSLWTIADPLPANSRLSIEQMVSRVFTRCEAIVVVNATSFLKMLKPVISLMIPAHKGKLFVSTDSSALLHVAQPSDIPRPYNPNSTAGMTDSPQTVQLYELLNERAKEVLGRPLQVTFASELPLRVPSETSTARQPLVAHKPSAADPTDSESTWAAEAEGDDFDDID